MTMRSCRSDEVPGEPRGKGRHRFIRNTGVTYTPPETRAYEKKIMDCYRAQCRGAYWPEDKFVSVNVTAVYPIPKSAKKATRSAIDQGTILLDSLNGIAYKDDSQVVMVAGRKIYGEEPKLIIEIHGR